MGSKFEAVFEVPRSSSRSRSPTATVVTDTHVPDVFKASSIIATFTHPLPPLHYCISVSATLTILPMLLSAASALLKSHLGRSPVPSLYVRCLASHATDTPRVAGLEGRGVIQLVGSESATFLQGLVTNDTRPLDKGVDGSVYKLRRSITVTDVSSQYKVWTMFGGSTADMASKLTPKGAWLADPRLPELGLRAILPSNGTDLLLDIEASTSVRPVLCFLMRPTSAT
eukprot:gene6453-3085_t